MKKTYQSPAVIVKLIEIASIMTVSVNYSQTAADEDEEVLVKEHSSIWGINSDEDSSLW